MNSVFLAAASAGLNSRRADDFHTLKCSLSTLPQSTESEEHGQLGSYFAKGNECMCSGGNRIWTEVESCCLWRKAERSDFWLNYHDTKPRTPLNGNIQYLKKIIFMHDSVIYLPAGPCSPGAPWAGAAPISNEASGAVPPLPWRWRCDTEAGAVSNWTWYRKT